MKFVKTDPIKDLPQDRTALYAVIKNNIDINILVIYHIDYIKQFKISKMYKNLLYDMYYHPDKFEDTTRQETYNKELPQFITHYDNLHSVEYNIPMIYYCKTAANKPLLMCNIFKHNIDYNMDGLVCINEHYYFNINNIIHIDTNYIMFKDRSKDGTKLNTNETIYQNASVIINHCRKAKLNLLCDE